MQAFEYLAATMSGGSYTTDSPCGCTGDEEIQNCPHDDMKWQSINKLGEQGWELVSVVYDNETSASTGYFKRERLAK